MFLQQLQHDFNGITLLPLHNPTSEISIQYFYFGYEDISKEIPDPNVKKPEDWDDEEDGEWTVPTIINKFF
ncbi:hypothetical protein L1887_24091 [Cichorium endivia]|nr:hypothetical protein L1887_24091 [Cichorium endivia]